jgi:RNA polymerase sigma-70 factor (ECF subfamily)
MSSDFDQDTMRQAFAGNHQAFRLLVRAYSLGIRSYIASQVFRLDEVDDLAQDVFLSAWANRSTFDTQQDVGAWLRGIARNKLLTHFRSIRRKESAMDELREQARLLLDDELESLSQKETHRSIEALLRCVEQLPERLRQVVHAGLSGTRSMRIAEQLEISAAAVYNLSYRANNLLRECVKSEVEA